MSSNPLLRPRNLHRPSSGFHSVSLLILAPLQLSLLSIEPPRTDLPPRSHILEQKFLLFIMISRMKSRAGSGRVSMVLILSYVLDWIIVIVAAGIGGGFSVITPNKRPFSLSDADIAFPYVTKEKVSTATLILCGLAAPAIIIFLVTMLLVPGPTVPKSTPKGLIWRRKLWELHTGWLGLGLSLAAAFLITSGMKNLFGKPRVRYRYPFQNLVPHFDIFRVTC